MIARCKADAGRSLRRKRSVSARERHVHEPGDAVGRAEPADAAPSQGPNGARLRRSGTGTPPATLASASPAALVWLCGGILLAFFLYLIVTVGRIDAAVPGHDAIATCIETYRATTQATNVNVGVLYDLNGFCYDTIG